MLDTALVPRLSNVYDEYDNAHFSNVLSGETDFKTLKLDDSEVSSGKCVKILKVMVSSHQK